MDRRERGTRQRLRIGERRWTYESRPKRRSSSSASRRSRIIANLRGRGTSLVRMRWPHRLRRSDPSSVVVCNPLFIRFVADPPTSNTTNSYLEAIHHHILIHASILTSVPDTPSDSLQTR
uniref:Expressed protein n=1 Tax=Schizophyllum commune (strain H4-8 / FGSC 9210) TaxID=578458 RepID=D8QJU7_SCHCM